MNKKTDAKAVHKIFRKMRLGLGLSQMPLGNSAGVKRSGETNVPQISDVAELQTLFFGRNRACQARERECDSGGNNSESQESDSESEENNSYSGGNTQIEGGAVKRTRPG